MVLALPIGDPQQCVGRAERSAPGKLVPRVVDFIDVFSLFETMQWRRRKFFVSRGFSITTRDVKPRAT
jgi:hypothetical protein